MGEHGPFKVHTCTQSIGLDLKNKEELKGFKMGVLFTFLLFTLCSSARFG
jgi:hypothetical protein